MDTNLITTRAMSHLFGRENAQAFIESIEKELSQYADIQHIGTQDLSPLSIFMAQMHQKDVAKFHKENI